jgi:MFS family permease
MLGGLTPAITALIRIHAPPDARGAALGYSQSAQFVGQVLGPLFGGYIVGFWSITGVFFATSAVLMIGALYNFATYLSYTADGA